MLETAGVVRMLGQRQDTHGVFDWLVVGRFARWSQLFLFHVAVAGSVVVVGWKGG